MGYHARILDDGQIVLPAELGRDIGLQLGDGLVVERDGESFIVKRERSPEHARGRLREAMHGYTVDQFIAERATDWR